MTGSPRVLSLLLAVTTALPLACGDGGVTEPRPQPIRVIPQFRESAAGRAPRTFDYLLSEVSFAGGEGYDGSTGNYLAFPGAVVTIGVQDARYAPFSQAFTVPAVEYAWTPLITLVRIAPAALRAEWAANAAGATFRVELFAPDGLGGVVLDSLLVMLGACRGTNFFDPNYRCVHEYAHGGGWVTEWAPADTVGWARLGSLVGWPGLPPVGYTDGGGMREWAGMAQVRFRVGADWWATFCTLRNDALHPEVEIACRSGG